MSLKFLFLVEIIVCVYRNGLYSENCQHYKTLLNILSTALRWSVYNLKWYTLYKQSIRNKLFKVLKIKRIPQSRGQQTMAHGPNPASPLPFFFFFNHLWPKYDFHILEWFRKKERKKDKTCEDHLQFKLQCS